MKKINFLFSSLVSLNTSTIIFQQKWVVIILKQTPPTFLHIPRLKFYIHFSFAFLLCYLRATILGVILRKVFPLTQCYNNSVTLYLYFWTMFLYIQISIYNLYLYNLKRCCSVARTLCSLLFVVLYYTYYI